MSRNSMLIGGGAVVGLIATFLPWYSASFSCSGSAFCGNFSVSVSGFHTWGILFFLAALVLTALVAARQFAGNSMPALPWQDWMISLILSALMIVGAILAWLTFGGDTASGPGYSAGASFGLFLGLIAAIVAAVGSYMSKTDPQPATGAMNFGTPPSSAPPPPPAPPAPPIQ